VNPPTRVGRKLLKGRKKNDGLVTVGRAKTRCIEKNWCEQKNAGEAKKIRASQGGNLGSKKVGRGNKLGGPAMLGTRGNPGEEHLDRSLDGGNGQGTRKANKRKEKKRREARRDYRAKADGCK